MQGCQTVTPSLIPTQHSPAWGLVRQTNASSTAALFSAEGTGQPCYGAAKLVIPSSIGQKFKEQKELLDNFLKLKLPNFQTSIKN